MRKKNTHSQRFIHNSIILCVYVFARVFPTESDEENEMRVKKNTTFVTAC